MKQKNILVTKTKNNADLLMDELRSINLNPLYLELVGIREKNIKFEKLHLEQFDIFVFISQSAVEHFFSQLKLNSNSRNFQNTIDKYFKTKVISAVGKSSAKNIQNIIGEDKYIIYPQNSIYNSDTLIEELKSFYKNNKDYNLYISKSKFAPKESLGTNTLHNKNIAIIKGVGGREYLTTTLLSLNNKVTEINVYERYLPNKSYNEFKEILKNNKLDNILLTCNTGLENLQYIAKENKIDIKNINYIAISQRIADNAIKLGYKNVHVINNLNVKEIANCIETGTNR